MTRLKSTMVDLEGSWQEAFDYFYEHRMTDGLPIVPPTPERVTTMLGSTLRGPGEVIARVPPLWGKATVEKIAVNAVMAGCAPEYLPVVIAAVEGICEPEFNLHGVQTCTGAVGPLLVVNGPIRDRLDINYGAGVLGPGRRSNATIGRAVRFVMLNIGGATAGDVDKATMGWPGKYTCCVGENESLSPWEPLHVERGFQPDDSTVTVLGVEGSTQITDISPWPEQWAHCLAYGLIKLPLGRAYGPDEGSRQPGLGPILLMNPVFASRFADAGYTKASFKDYLWETARYPLNWIPKGHTWELHSEPAVPMAETADLFQIIVTGSESGYHCTAMSGLMGKPVTKQIEG